MQQLILAQEELFQGVHCDIWRDSNRNPFMTIEQMANALEYKSKKGIEQILERQPYLKNAEFSILSKVPLKLGGTQEMRLFTFDGIMEVAFLSSKPKAQEFRSWARKVIKAFVTGQLIWKEERGSGKTVHKKMTDAIKEKEFSPHYYKHFTDLAYKTAVGFTAKQLREARGANSKSSPLDYLTAEELAAVNKREMDISVLIMLDLDYPTIKATLNNQGVIYQTTLKIPIGKAVVSGEADNR
ncbi:transcriptional regulator [Enterococcus faecalis]|uniref:BRO family protein n=1 Tax=Enterococcus faecalis TaxID=1351 RepID=UPI00045B90DB|nr:BRO family protein [Enterococcus faecalis]EGO9051638.1 transcriptional regulator [Enterococcus faecalis]EHH3130693.1 transcriptional regulator [Enterococcus faecalis]EHS2085478.1 transcriptional regulator [Enterococcus faecalis]KAJ61903.1 prophage Sa05, BRO domain protein [Enterococcus faecalis GA2]HAP2777968.1 transcriptional regulator [Enterococcus faecalis]